MPENNLAQFNDFFVQEMQKTVLIIAFQITKNSLGSERHIS